MIDIDLESLHDVEVRSVGGRTFIYFKSIYGERIGITLSQRGGEWLQEELNNALSKELDVAI